MELRDANALTQDYRNMCTDEYSPMRTALGSGCCPTCGLPAGPPHYCRRFVCSVKVTEVLFWRTGTSTLEEYLCELASGGKDPRNYEVELNGIGSDVEFLIYAIL